MKDWIQNNYGEKLNYDQLRGVVNAAWEQISSEFLRFGGFYAGSLRSNYSNQRYVLTIKSPDTVVYRRRVNHRRFHSRCEGSNSVVHKLDSSYVQEG